MQDLCVTATRDRNVYASFRPSIATKDAETRSKMNSAISLMSCLCKTMERMINTRVVWFQEKIFDQNLKVVLEKVELQQTS